MKRTLLLLVSTLFIVTLNAQSPSAEHALSVMPKVTNDIAVKAEINLVGGAILGPVKEKRLRASDCTIGEVIGETTYDLQTNSSTGNRLLPASATQHYHVWTGSDELTTSWTDRGTFYNFSTAGTWGTAPTTREETLRTGWPTLVHVTSGEVLFSHDFSGYGYTVMNKRSTVGSGSWTEDKTKLKGIWPRAISPDPSGDIIHVINTNYENGSSNNYLMYHRSMDGGVTFDIADSVLPGIDSITGGYAVMVADAYALDALGATVAIASGSTINDWAVWKSTDTGNTWTRTRILDFPIDNFKGNQLTDTNMDSNVDTLLATGSDIAVLIDNTGKVHAWAGAMRMMDTDASPGSGWSFFPGTGGLFYWNEDMGADSFQTIALTDDIDSDGTLGGIGRDVTGSYGTGLVSIPTASIDATSGAIYITFMNAVEYSDVIEDPTDAAAQSFRDIYGMYTTNGGTTWNGPFNLTRTACNWEENSYPQSYRYTTGSEIVLAWQTDEEPGISVGTNADHSVTTNEIMFKKIPYTDFATYMPVADFSCVTNPSNGFTIFTNNSCQTDCTPGSWTWDFDDGTPDSDLREPTHTFAEGTYNVCLTVTNRYGSDMHCKTVTVTGIDELTYNKDIKVYPNPSSGHLSLESEIDLINAEISVTNVIGEVVLQHWGADIYAGQEIALDLSEMTTGTYLVHIRADNAVRTMQIFLQ